MHDYPGYAIIGSGMVTRGILLLRMIKAAWQKFMHVYSNMDCHFYFTSIFRLDFRVVGGQAPKPFPFKIILRL